MTIPAPETQNNSAEDETELCLWGRLCASSVDDGHKTYLI